MSQQQQYGVHIGRYLATVRIDDLDHDSRELAELIGMDAMRAVLAMFGGESIHIPMARRLRLSVERYVVNHYEQYADGSDNLRSIAREVGVSVRVVRRIVQSREE